jgi:N-acetylated-alpha-linked acidic dipeptidase
MSFLKKFFYLAFGLGLTTLFTADEWAQKRAEAAVRFREFGDERIKGFTLDSTREERQIEAALKKLADPKVYEKHLRFLTEEPHIAGSKRNYELAVYVRDKFKEYGLEDVELVEYQVLLSFPKDIIVEMVEPALFKATLREEGYPVDKDSFNGQVSIGFNAYSASGEVTAPVVYVYGGNPEDYDRLSEMGIDIKGKIALVRYSEPYSYRGFKALTAQRRGAAGLLIYSDPSDDGYVRGDVFPNGPWGPESHIQRGGIPFDFIVPGDPLTPGWASIPGARRLKPEESEILPKIMAVPLSHKEARPFLENLAGPAVPQEWQGGLPLTYHVGPGPAKVHLKVEMDNSVGSIWNVVGKIKGREEPEKWVVLGNHRDAWVYGAVDPSSGTAAMLGLAQNLGQLVKDGYRPKRSLIFCNWDAEENTLTGSTEWAEQHADKLKKDGVVYINVDSAASGPNFGAAAVPSLGDLMLQITHEVLDPCTGETIYEAMKLFKQGKDQTGETRLIETRVGSGSDHTAFLNFVCMPVLGMGFDGPYGVYHSQYDDFYWMSHFGDPEFRYHATLATLWGMAALRLANAQICPFDYEAYAGEIGSYVKEILSPGEKSISPGLNLLVSRIESFQKTARELNIHIERLLSQESKVSSEILQVLNAALMQAERDFGFPWGIPKRPWFKHLIYACKFTYAPEVLPGLTEAVEEKDWTRAKEQISLLDKAISRADRTLGEVLIKVLKNQKGE